MRHKKGSATGSFHKGAVTNSYAYDGMMRLVAESGPGGGTAYAYDLCGNRLSVTAQGGTTSNTYTHNRRDADTCDAAGNVTRTVNARGQTLDLSWNLQRQLVSVSTNGVFAESYAYDPLGRRVSTTDMSGTVYHAYDGIHCVADMDGDGGILRAYTWGAGVDNLLAVTLIDGAATNTLYAVTDPLGTVHALIATDGTVSVSYTYDSWGNLLSVSGDETLIASLRFTWQGREYSYATGLHNFRARWYDPAAGRWLSKDPIGLEGGLNLYEAFGNNPVCFGDPEGELVLFDYGLFEDFLADYMPDFFEDRYPLIEPSAHSVFDILAEWINEPLVIARENITIKIMQIRESVFGAYRPECGNEGYYFQQGTKQEIITGDDIREALFLSTLKGRPGMKKQGRELRTKARLNGRYKGNERFRRERPPKQHTPGKTHRRKSKGKGK